MQEGITQGTGRPPLWRVLAYRVFWVRIPSRWGAWAEADLLRANWPLRQTAWQFAGVLIVMVIFGLAGVSVSAIVLPTAGALVGSVLAWRVFGERRREEMLRYQRGERGYPMFVGPKTKLQRFVLAAFLVVMVASLAVFVVLFATTL